MKSKGSASLYEVLKSASRPGSDSASAVPPASEAPPPGAEGAKTLQERLAEYKARRLADVGAAPAPVADSAAVAVAEPTPLPVAAHEPTPPPIITPAPSRSTQILTPLPSAPELGKKASSGPGERTLRLTLNTAAFAALVGIGLLFVAYAVGVKVGRSRVADVAPEPISAAPTPPAATPKPPDVRPVPPPAPKLYTIHLAEWPVRTAQERLKAADQADTYKKALDRANFKNAETLKIVRGGEERLALYLDRTKDAGSEAAKARLASIQKLKVQSQLPFAQAGYEEVPK